MNKFSKKNMFFLPFLIMFFSFTIYNLFYFSFFQFAFFHLEQLQRLTLSRVVLQWQQITIHCRLSYCMRPNSLFISFLDIYFSFTALHISLLYGKYLSWIFISLLHVYLISLFIWKYLSWIFISLLLSAIFPFSYGKYISWISIYLLHVHYISLFIWKIFSLFLDIYFPFYCPPYFPFHIWKILCPFLDIYFSFYCPPYFPFHMENIFLGYLFIFYMSTIFPLSWIFISLFTVHHISWLRPRSHIVAPACPMCL